MPTYDYRCQACGHEVEVVHGVHAHGPSTCPACGGPMRKVFAPPTVHFKGSGWAKKERASSSMGKPKPAKGASAGGANGGSGASAEPGPTDGAGSGDRGGSGDHVGPGDRGASGERAGSGDRGRSRDGADSRERAGSGGQDGSGAAPTASPSGGE